MTSKGSPLINETNLLEIIKKGFYDGIFVSDKGGKILFINDSYSRITGFDGQKLIGKNAYKLKEIGVVDTTLFDRVHQSQKAMSMILSYTHSKKEALVTVIPIFNQTGEFIASIGNVRDIEELDKLKTKLTRLHKQSDDTEERFVEDDRFKEIKIRDILDRTFVAKSKQMRSLVDLALQIAKVDSTILITGESGVGKDVYAKLLLRIASQGTLKPFIKVSCAAIPETLLESELFGYKEGAFTGAQKKGKPGAFELAGDGIIFLDEIGEMPLSLQVKLLTVLQDKEFLPLGGTHPIQMRAKVVAATNKDLAEAVEKKEFRQDLYYRLNVIPIEIPPLRERIEDIIPLTIMFTRSLNEKHNINKTFDSSVLDVFEHFYWPGNVRELFNIIERMVLLSPDDLITLEQLPYYMKVTEKKLKNADYDVELKLFMEQMEQLRITKALERQNSFKNAAQELGIDQSTLTRKIQKYGLPKKNKTKHIHDDLKEIKLT